jgi:hypothetical protein
VIGWVIVIIGVIAKNWENDEREVMKQNNIEK